VSAPTALDGGALLEGLAWRMPERSAPEPGVPRDGRERRRADLLARLTRDHDALCTQAADRYEIAAGLEAAGVTDRQARMTFGVASVFELAEAVYRIVPRRLALVDAPDDPWRRPIGHHLLRGLLYALPSLLYVLALRTVHPGTAVVLLLAASGLAAALGQALSLLGYVLIGAGQPEAAGTLFRRALVAGGLLIGVLAMAGTALPGLSPGVGLLAAGQVEYLLAATVLMVVQADLLLMAVLVPGLVASAVLLSVRDQLSPPLVGAVLGLTLLGAVAAAGSRLRPAKGSLAPGAPPLRRRLGRVELRLAGAYAGYGAANAGLLSFVVIDLLTHRGSGSGAQVAVAMAPLVASLGIADWLIHRLRSRACRALAETASPDEFRREVRAGFDRTVVGYVASVGALVAAVQGAAAAGGLRITPVGILDSGGYAVLGVAFLLDTVLLSLGRPRAAVGLTVTALAVDVFLRWTPAGAAGGTPLATAHLAVFGTLALTLLPVARSAYGSVSRHR